MGQALTLVAWTHDVVTMSSQQQGSGKGCITFTALHLSAVIQWQHPWPSVAIHTAAGSWGVLGGYSPFSPRRMAFSRRCHHDTEDLSDLHERALPALGPQVLTLPQQFTPRIAWLSSLSCCTDNILQRMSPPRCLEKLKNRNGWACFLVICSFLVLWNNHKHSNYCKDKIARIMKSSQAKLSIN